MASATAHNFTILTESETSVAFCRQLLPDDFKDPELARDHMSCQNFMVVDAGGMCVIMASERVLSYIYQWKDSTYVTLCNSIQFVSPK